MRGLDHEKVGRNRITEWDGKIEQRESSENYGGQGGELNCEHKTV